MTPFNTGLTYVLEQLTARQRLLGDTASASPEILRGLLRAAAGSIPAGSSAPAKTASAPDVLAPTTARTADHPAEMSGNSPENSSGVVFGEGNLAASLLFVGDTMAGDEAGGGDFFAGEAGQLLIRMIQAMGLQREDVYLVTLRKDRLPTAADGAARGAGQSNGIGASRPEILEQIARVQPQVIVSLGATALEGLLGEKRPLGEQRGQWVDCAGIPLLATYHPSYLLRNRATSEKRKVWEDLLLVMEKLTLPISTKQRQFFTR